MFSSFFKTTAVTVALAVAVSACATPPSDLDLSLEKQSVSGRYVVSLAPPATAPAINQMHSWTVQLKDPTGKPVNGATLQVGGGMPQHFHGFPTRPRVTRELEGGTYLVEGVKFSMPGWWDFKFDIHGADGDDQVTFNTVVAPAIAKR